MGDTSIDSSSRIFFGLILRSSKIHSAAENPRNYESRIPVLHIIPQIEAFVLKKATTYVWFRPYLSDNDRWFHAPQQNGELETAVQI